MLTTPKTYDDFSGPAAQFSILECISGSRAYGTNSKSSDYDIRGIYVLPYSCYLNLNQPAEQISDASNDTVYYALRRFLELASAANPNFLELLYLPKDCYLKTTDLGKQLIAVRQHFVTKCAFDSHVAYAMAQVKRARGQNKWVNNPKPDTPPSREDYCWIIPREHAQWNYPKPPFRPVGLKKSGVDLSECHIASVEHVPGVYRLYKIGPSAKGVFRGSNLECESIPKELEQSACIGLFIYNYQAYEAEAKDHRHYWKWRQLRNDERWLNQEQKSLDYDAKNLMHTFRLLISAQCILEHGTPCVRFEGKELNFLLSIRSGNFTYEELLEMANDRIELLTELNQKSTLPDKPDRAYVNDLLHSLTSQWETANA